MSLLSVRNLSVAFPTQNGWFQAVEGINLSVNPNEILAIVGESGSGKSVAMLALMNLLPPQARITCDELILDGKNLLQLNATERRRLNGGTVAMIFQEPMTSLNPCFTVGYQIDEAVKTHLGGSSKERKEHVLGLLEAVGIPDPARRYHAYPHQMSGGMSQRAMIAMALAGQPKLLIADEPTTALDVTVQAQILELLMKLQQQFNMGLILITHDMGVVAETAQQVVVQYAGQQVEKHVAYELFNHPHHPYTAALLSALPERAPPTGLLPTIPGLVPGQQDRPQGCLFAPRCSSQQARCQTETPTLEPYQQGWIRCFYPLETRP
ncbi:MAG: ABC transporter ATP-binding protein [Thiofilum sp.]|uniref:ABC transporter ATP-binding protein n=1 Tax=Thiofilum sp. TaxID=2212733 RepID=UPI0025CC2007|nr:ABC transporter ATP-binding protein [Thiofilum sp.]MBK8454485.1 ABC transporter ATP-binding protein [Thiofilum sp.]